jgi:hypothetical protein
MAKTKFEITPERFAEACSALEYLLISNGDKKTAMRIVARFAMENGKYIMQVKQDDDGDIAGFENEKEALSKLGKVKTQRLESLANEVMEAANALVSP